MTKLTLVVLLALVSCGTFDKPSSCSGPSFRLNEDQWEVSPLPRIKPALKAGAHHD